MILRTARLFASNRRLWWPSGVYDAHRCCLEQLAACKRLGTYHSDSQLALVLSRRKAKRALTRRT